MPRGASHRVGPHQLPTTAYVVLGLVGTGPPHPKAGYELAAFAARGIAHMWPIAKSQVYTELTRLEELGLVSGTDVPQENLPDKRVYALTEQGRAALHDWIADPAVEERARSSALTKLFFGAHAQRAEVHRLLDDLAARSRERRDHLQGVVDHLEHIPPALFPRMCALFAVRQAEATLAWIDEVRPLL